MRKILVSLSLIFSFLAFQATAQYAVTKEGFQISVKKFPSYYIEPEKRTYYIKLVNNVSEYLDSLYFKTNIDLPGWEEADESEAFLQMYITVNPVYFEATDYKDLRSEDRTKEGELVVSHRIKPSIRYTFNMKCQFKCPYEIFERRSTLLGASASKTYDVSDEFPSMAKAQEYVSQQKPSIVSSIVNSDVKNFLKIVNEALTEKFYPAEGVEKFQLGFLEDPNCPFYQTMVDAKKYLEQEFELINHEKPISYSVSNITIWIEKLQNIAGELNTSEPAQKKAKEEVIRDLAVLYYVLEDFNNALLYAQVLKDTFQSRDGDRIIRSIKALQSDFDTFHQTSRHFSLD